ncbi:uncharacterized protein LOC131215999 [Anopheles bellator]|uniref:uncharacterized protein LOC131215999 n=1 Tax=Anopheles bellator TaxID=139047 RepID=UPI0026479346|nr:uncharacterized protein LOC131215999 [Anopheles bellator]
MIWLTALTIVISAVGADLKAEPQNRAMTARQSWPLNHHGWDWGWGWGWGWAIAVFVLAIVKGSIWLGIVMIWAFFRGFPAKHSHCETPIILREPIPYFHDHHHGHEEIIWDKPPHRRRSIRQAPGEESADLMVTDMLTDLAFSFLGVGTRDCRKRFVCEVDVRARDDFLLKLGTRMLGVDIFRKYRSADDVAAQSIEQCAQLFSNCKTKGPSISMNVFDGPDQRPFKDYDEAVPVQEDQ